MKFLKLSKTSREKGRKREQKKKNHEDLSPRETAMLIIERTSQQGESAQITDPGIISRQKGQTHKTAQS